MLLHYYIINTLYGEQSENFFIQIPLIIKPEDIFIKMLRLKCSTMDSVPDLIEYAIKYIYCGKGEFISLYEKQIMEECFCKIQKIYHAFCKLSNIYKYKIAKKNIIKEDLYMIPFNEIKDHHIIELYENKNLYKFNIKNLIQIIINSLTNNCNLIVEPIAIKNPYTNTPFNKSILYTIYFKIKNSKFIMPEIFHLYFLQNFEIFTLILNYEPYIRNYIINKYNKVLDNDEIQDYIYEMVHKYTDLNIHKEFPYIELYKTFYQYLSFYLHAEYSFSPSKRSLFKKTLHKILKPYNKRICKYGRKIFKKNNFTQNSYYFITTC